jgi:hypothetical protein
MADSVWDVLDWGATIQLSEGSGVMARVAYAVTGSADPDAEFVRLARAYITGNPNVHGARRTRVTEMAAAFNVDRKVLAKYLRGKGVIGPMD